MEEGRSVGADEEARNSTAGESFSTPIESREPVDEEEEKTEERR